MVLDMQESSKHVSIDFCSLFRLSIMAYKKVQEEKNLTNNATVW